MIDAGYPTTGVDGIIEGGIRLIDLGANVVSRHSRLSHLLKSLRPGCAEDYLRMLSVEYVGPETVVDLTEHPTREDVHRASIDHLGTSTHTIVRANWGGDGLSKLFVTALRSKNEEGVVKTANFRSGRPFIDNSLRLGLVMHAARVASGMQQRQQR